MIRIAIAIVLVATIAHAADIPFSLQWDAPTKHLDGSLGTPSGYIVYACDGVISKPSLSAPTTCPGNMVQYQTTETTLSGTYAVSSNKGYIFFKVTALNETGGESLLSNLAIKRYDTLNTTEPPSNLRLDNSCSVVVNQICEP